MTTDPAAAVEAIRELLPHISLESIIFLNVEMRRKEGDPPEKGTQFPVDLTVLHQSAEGSAAFQVKVAVERPDIEVSVAVMVEYSLPAPDRLTDPVFAQKFAERIAIPAAYPFARAKIHEVTVDAGTAPVTLNLINPSALGLSNTGVNEANTEDGGEAPTEA